MGFPGGTSGKNLPANTGGIRDVGSIPGSGRAPGGEHGNPLQSSCLENPHGQRSLLGCSPWDLKESDTTEVTVVDVKHLKPSYFRSLTKSPG